MTSLCRSCSTIWRAHTPTPGATQAIATYERVLPLLDGEALAEACDALGLIHYGLGNDEPALALTRRALALYRQLGRDDLELLAERLQELESPS